MNHDNSDTNIGDKIFYRTVVEEDREKSLQAGLNGHIAKPLKVNELMSDLKRLVV